jgi:hypothetical protein
MIKFGKYRVQAYITLTQKEINEILTEQSNGLYFWEYNRKLDDYCGYKKGKPSEEASREVRRILSRYYHVRITDIIFVDFFETEEEPPEDEYIPYFCMRVATSKLLPATVEYGAEYMIEMPKQEALKLLQKINPDIEYLTHIVNSLAYKLRNDDYEYYDSMDLVATLSAYFGIEVFDITTNITRYVYINDRYKSTEFDTVYFHLFHFDK